MSRMMFVNIAVRDVSASRAFFDRLGFEFNEQFSDENTLSVRINDQTLVMMLAEPRFRDFIDGEIADTTQAHEALLAVSADNREDVDSFVAIALAAGGSPWKPVNDEGYMYGHSVRDLDGHVWEVVWMDPAAIAG